MQGERIFVFSLQRNFGEQISNRAKKWSRANEEGGRAAGVAVCRTRMGSMGSEE